MSAQRARRIPPDRGVLGQWAWDARHLLKIASTDDMAKMLPERTVDPASWRKVETGASVSQELWTEVGNLYARLAQEKGIDLPKQPAHPAMGGQDAPVSVQAQLRSLADQVQTLVAAQVTPETLAELIGVAVRDAVREAMQAAVRDGSLRVP